MFSNPQFIKFYRERLPFILFVSLFVVSFLVPDKKLATNFFRVVVCVPVLFMFTKEKFRDFLSSVFVRLLAVSFLWTLLTLFWSPTDIIVNISGRILTSFLLAYLIFLVFNYDHAREELIPYLYIFLGLASMVLVVFNWDDITQLNRWEISYGILNHHAPLSWFFTTCALISFYKFLSCRKLWFLLPSLLFFVMVFLSQSRGGIVSLFSGILFLLAFKYGFSLKKLSLFTLVLAFLISTVLFFEIDFVKELVDRGSSGRFHIYKNFFETISVSLGVMLFGYGAGADTSNFVGSFEADHYHNFYLNTWYYTGFVGLFLVMLLVFYRFFVIYKSRELGVWDAPLFAILVAFLFDGGRWYGYPEAMMFSFFIPLVMANMKCQTSTSSTAINPQDSSP